VIAKIHEFRGAPGTNLLNGRVALSRNVERHGADPRPDATNALRICGLAKSNPKSQKPKPESK
jgi:hypothetical protein